MLSASSAEFDVSPLTSIFLKDIETQKDAGSCGVYAVINAYRLLTSDGTDSLKDKGSLQYVHLWIANNVIERRFSRQSEPRKSSRNIVLPWLSAKNAKLDIVEWVPSSSTEPGEFFYNLRHLAD